MLTLVPYDQQFLQKSREWLRDPEIRTLTRTPEFTDEQQQAFFDSLPGRLDYRIFGLLYEGEAIGAAGLKHIDGEAAEYWGYIGEKALWGKSLGADIVFNLFEEGRRLGLTRLYLKVGSGNERAIGLYLKMGFQVTETYVDHLVMNILLGDTKCFR